MECLRQLPDQFVNFPVFPRALGHPKLHIPTYLAIKLSIYQLYANRLYSVVNRELEKMVPTAKIPSFVGSVAKDFETSLFIVLFTSHFVPWTFVNIV